MQLKLCLGANIAPSCWAVIHGDDRQTKVIVAKEKDIYILDYSEQHVAQRIPEISHHHLSIVAMAISPCTKLTAILTDAGNYNLFSTVPINKCLHFLILKALYGSVPRIFGENSVNMTPSVYHLPCS